MSYSYTFNVTKRTSEYRLGKPLSRPQYEGNNRIENPLPPRSPRSARTLKHETCSIDLFFDVFADGRLNKFFDLAGQVRDVGQFEIFVMAGFKFALHVFGKEAYADYRYGIRPAESSTGVLGKFHPRFLTDEDQRFAGKNRGGKIVS